MKRTKKILIICFIVFCLCGCEQKKSSYLPDADVGILLTTFQTGKTMVRTYSKTGKKLQETKYSYGAVGNCGFTVPQMKNKIAYEIALGDDEEADLGAVLAFDISHNSYKRIDFGRNNITETKVDGRYLYCISNNNRITYFDRYDLKTQKKSSYVWKDGTTTNFCVHNDKIYAIDMENCVLYQLDFGKKKISPICNLKKEFGKDFCEGFLVANDDFLYMTSYNHSLISVDLHTKKITTKDFKYAEKLGYVVKLLATSCKENDKVYAITAPFMINSTHPLYNVNDVLNGIYIHGNVIGNVMFFGAGAGKLPTASAVVADVVDCVKHKGKNVMTVWSVEKLELGDADDEVRKFFVRVKGNVSDLSAVNAAFGNVQTVTVDGIDGEFGFITEPMSERAFAEAAKKIDMIHRIRIDETTI